MVKVIPSTLLLHTTVLVVGGCGLLSLIHFFLKEKGGKATLNYSLWSTIKCM